MSTSSIAEWFQCADAERQPILDTARRCAALSKPWILPPQGQSPNDRLPENFQSLGSRGITNLEGRMLLALFPPSQPFFQFRMDPAIEFNPEVPAEAVQAINNQLYLLELQAMAALELGSAKLGAMGSTRRSFHSQKRAAISQVLVTGDVLEHLTDDMRIRVFRRDQYVTVRDSAGSVLAHGIRERIDPLTLGEEELSKANLRREDLTAKRVHERLVDMFTRVEWDPVGGMWRIEQEVNGHVIRATDEPVTPYFSTPFELAPGEHYGRGFIEQNKGDLSTLDALEERLIDFAAAASKFHPVIDDATSTLRPDDLAKPTGTVLRGRVSGGQVQDVGVLQLSRLADFQVVFQSAERKRKDLGSAMLIPSEAVPEKDRVTARQVEEVAAELQGALGAFYAPVADDQQLPLIARVRHVMERKRLMPVLGDNVQTRVQTGVAALTRELDAAKLFRAIQALGQLGPDVAARLNTGFIADLVLRYTGTNPVGLLKSDEQMARERAQAMREQLASEAGSEAVNVAGDVARAQLSPTTERNA